MLPHSFRTAFYPIGHVEGLPTQLLLCFSTRLGLVHCCLQQVKNNTTHNTLQAGMMSMVMCIQSGGVRSQSQVVTRYSFEDTCWCQVGGHTISTVHLWSNHTWDGLKNPGGNRLLDHAPGCHASKSKMSLQEMINIIMRIVSLRHRWTLCGLWAVT